MSEAEFRRIMLTYLHIPYIYGGDDPILGTDCSGLAQELLAILGYDPEGDQTAHGLYQYFVEKYNGVSTAPQTGALVFYGTPDKITHVAMCYNELLVLEAGGGGSKTKTREDAIKQNAFIRLRPVNHRKDLVSITKPIGLPLE